MQRRVVEDEVAAEPAGFEQLNGCGDGLGRVHTTTLGRLRSG
jgi:hypothetical protein